MGNGTKIQSIMFLKIFTDIYSTIHYSCNLNDLQMHAPYIKKIMPEIFYPSTNLIQTLLLYCPSTGPKTNKHVETSQLHPNI